MSCIEQVAKGYFASFEAFNSLNKVKNAKFEAWAKLIGAIFAAVFTLGILPGVFYRVSRKIERRDPSNLPPTDQNIQNIVSSPPKADEEAGQNIQGVVSPPPEADEEAGQNIEEVVSPTPEADKEKDLQEKNTEMRREITEALAKEFRGRLKDPGSNLSPGEFYITVEEKSFCLTMQTESSQHRVSLATLDKGKAIEKIKIFADLMKDPKVTLVDGEEHDRNSKNIIIRIMKTEAMTVIFIKGDASSSNSDFFLMNNQDASFLCEKIEKGRQINQKKWGHSKG